MGVSGAFSMGQHSLMTNDESHLLQTICQGKNVVEIGSYRGGSAEAIAKVCRHLTCIDPHGDLNFGDYTDDGEDIQAEFLRTISPFHNITYIRDYSDRARHLVSSFDVVLIDGEHSYDQCLKDLQNYRTQYMLVHDYCLMFTGVIAACQNYFGRLPDQLVGSLAYYE